MTAIESVTPNWKKNEGVRLLSPTTVALMTSNHVGTLYQDGALGWGLGFEVVEQRGRAPRYGAAGEFSWSGAYHTTYWADPAERSVHVLLTKADKLTRNEARATLAAGGKQLGERGTVQLFSSHSGAGVPEAQHALLEMM